MMKLSYPEKTKEEVKFTENFLQSVDTLTDLVEDTISLYETGKTVRPTLSAGGIFEYRLKYMG